MENPMVYHNNIHAKCGFLYTHGMDGMGIGDGHFLPLMTGNPQKTLGIYKPPYGIRLLSLSLP